MNKSKLKVSELIKNSCCGNFLDVPKPELIIMAKKLEYDNDRLTSKVKRLEADKAKSFNTMLCLFFGSIISVIFFAMVK